MPKYEQPYKLWIKRDKYFFKNIHTYGHIYTHMDTPVHIWTHTSCQTYICHPCLGNLVWKPGKICWWQLWLRQPRNPNSNEMGCHNSFVWQITWNTCKKLQSNPTNIQSKTQNTKLNNTAPRTMVLPCGLANHLEHRSLTISAMKYYCIWQTKCFTIVHVN